ncbi:MAG: GNAT family N-acetyltransferase [Chitinophagaceae bacterium]|jgi:GNAT superfamily N-acetyltransferase
MEQTVFTIKAFQYKDVSAYKFIRLEALKNEPGNFGNSFQLESAYSDQQWLDRVTNPNGVCFGLYTEDDLIGITSIIITNTEMPDEAYMTQSYIRKDYRNQGLSKILYEERIKWARDRKLKKLIIGHRESNQSSKHANQKFGFKYTHQEDRTWPDGATEPMLYYELILKDE